MLEAKATTHDVPKCTVCGYVGKFKKPPLIYPRDVLISVVLFFLFGLGLVWFVIALLKKKSPSCPHCSSRGSLTYVYADEARQAS